MNINGVECDVCSTEVNGQKARLLTPCTVRGLPFADFAVSCFVERSPNPEEAALYAPCLMALYYVQCYRHLLNKRSFDLSSFSSQYYPTLGKLCESIKIESTGDPLLDKIQILIRLGRPDGLKSLEEILPGAIYQHPEWIPVENLEADTDTLADREWEKVKKALSKKIREGDEPLDKVCDELSDRYLTLVLFLAERTTFDVLHQGAEAVYQIIKEKLTPAERDLFRDGCLKSPQYLNRILCFDPSPIFPWFTQIIEKVYRKVGTERASRFLSPELVEKLRASYLSFYPFWLQYIGEDEKDRSRLRENDKDEPPGPKKKEHWEGKEEVPYWEGAEEYAKELPDYMADPFLTALLNLGYPYDRSKRGGKGAKKKEGVETVLSPLEREIVGLEAEGLSNKEIAQRVGHTPSYVSKIRKQVREVLRDTWERSSYKPFRKQMHGELRQLYMGLPPDKRPLFKDFYLGMVRRLIQRLPKNGQLSPELAEEAAIPSFLRN